MKLEKVKEKLISYAKNEDEEALRLLKGDAATLAENFREDPSYIVLNFYDEYEEAYNNCQFGFCARYEHALSDLFGVEPSSLFIGF